MPSNPFKNNQSPKQFGNQDGKRFGGWKNKNPRQGHAKRPPRFEAPPPPLENATPWVKFKDEIIHHKREEDHAKAVNTDCPEAKQFLKKREQSHRKAVIEQKMKEPTKWETFEEDDKQTKGGKSKNVKKAPPGNKASRAAATSFKPVNEMTFKEKNQVRRAVTAITIKNKMKRVGKINERDLKEAIIDLRRNGVLPKHKRKPN